MSKPEDVTDEAWKVADGIFHNVSNERLREAIARAIMSAEKRGEERERAACAGVANQMVYTPVSDGVAINLPSEAAHYMAAKIMEAIRARSA